MNKLAKTSTVPNIGSFITPAYGALLCEEFGLPDSAKRVRANLSAYKGFVFDGASMTPDAIASCLLGIPNLTRIALIHDLKYAYGIPGDDVAKLKADLELALDILEDVASTTVTLGILGAVHIGGDTSVGQSFSWGFANA